MHSVPNKETHIKNSDLLTDIVIGMSDGLIVPFALAAGLSGAGSSGSIVIIAGVAGIAAGSIAMGLGGYQAGKTGTGHHHADPEHEGIDTVQNNEKEKAKDFFSNIGLSEEMQQKAIDEMAKDQQQWAAFAMEYETVTDQPDPKRAIKSALNIGLSYAAGGLVTLSPYFFTAVPVDALPVSAVITLLCLLLFGFFRGRMAGRNPWTSALRATITGGLAAAAAFGVAKLFE